MNPVIQAYYMKKNMPTDFFERNFWAAATAAVVVFCTEGDWLHATQLFEDTLSVITFPRA